MPEELQSLIDRIQEEGVRKAQAEAEAILAAARQKADQIVAEAQEKADARRKQAEADAALFQERARKTLEQAARDILITVARGVENVFQGILNEAVAESLSPAVLTDLLGKVVDAYLQEAGAGNVEISVNPQDHAAVKQFLAGRCRDKMRTGLEIRAASDVIKGFKVALKDKHLYHDFTATAIAEALMNFLRGDLAEIVQRAAKQG